MYLYIIIHFLTVNSEHFLSFFTNMDMNNSQEFEIHQPQLDGDPLPITLPINPFPSQLNLQIAVAGIADVDSALLAADNNEQHEVHNQNLGSQGATDASHVLQQYQTVAEEIAQNVQQNSDGNNLLLVNEVSVKDDWNCDKCGHANAYNKVRCLACPRWRNGKRPNMKASSRAKDFAQHDTVPFNARVDLGKWICHGCSAINHKARCSVCSRWKGGRRFNLPKRKGGGSSDENTTMPWTCDGCGYANKSGKVRCGSCQHWKGGQRLNMRRTEVTTEAKKDVDTDTDDTQPQMIYKIYTNNCPWQCIKCGSSNGAAKLRCRACQSWKNCQERQQSEQLGVPGETTTSPTEAAMPDAIKTWVCTACNYSNVDLTQQCDSCQCQRTHGYVQQSNIDNQLHQNYQMNQLGMPDGNQGMSQQQKLPWVCLHCNRTNLGSKARCGGCQKWKGWCYFF